MSTCTVSVAGPALGCYNADTKAHARAHAHVEREGGEGEGEGGGGGGGETCPDPQEPTQTLVKSK